MTTYEIDRLYLALHTRDEDDAATSDSVRLFSGGMEVANFGASPPPIGKVALLETNISMLYPDVLNDELSIGLSGVGKWAPRSAFLWGRFQSRQSDYVPIAENLEAVPYNWVSQDIQEGVDRWKLNPLHYLNRNSGLNGIVIFIETAASFELQTPNWWLDKVIIPQFANNGVEIDKKDYNLLKSTFEKLELTRLLKTDPGTTGPIDLSLYSENATNVGEGVWSGALSFQTTLVKRGRQEPAATGESYLAHFRPGWLTNWAGVNRFTLITNHSDDPWQPNSLWIFGIGGHMSRYARLLGVYESSRQWFGQNPHVSETVRAWQNIYLHNHLSMLDIDNEP